MAFEKIQATGQVKGYKRTSDGIMVGFKNVLFTDAARGPLDLWLDSKMEVRVTIETFQDNLPMASERTSTMDFADDDEPEFTPDEEAQLDKADAKRRNL